ICISEDFMRVAKGGAIGLYVPSGPGFTDYHKQISISFHRALFQEKFRSVGDCVVAGHYFYLLADYPKEMVQMYILLGDPSLKLQLVTELFDLNIEPTRVIASQHLNFKVSGRVPHIRQGVACFYLTDPNNNIVIEPIKQKFFNSQLNFEFSLSQPIIRGEWILRAFCQDARHPERMASGKASFWVDIPYLKLIQVNKQLSNDNLTTGGEVKLTAEIENSGYLDITDAVVELYNWRNNEWEKEAETQTAVPHNSTQPVNFIVHPTGGINLYKLKLKNYFIPPDPTIEPVFEKIITLPIKRTGSYHPDIVLAPPLINLEQITSATGSIRAIVSGVIYNIGSDNFTGIKCSLLNAGKNILAEQTYPEDFFRELKPVNIKLSAVVNRIEELKKLILKTELTPENTPDANPQDNLIELNDKLLNLPDLVISEEDITFPDPNPTEGFTVFIDVVIHNKGKVAAKDFSVAGYDNHPLQGGGILFDYMNGTASKLIHYLAPNSSTKVRLRWDPIKNQGEKTIWVKVDATNKLFEENEDNNIASARLYIKKKAILKPAGIFLKEQTPEEKKQGIIQLQAVVKNIGETDAHNVFVEIYKTDIQTPENLLEKVFIPEVKAGEEQVAKATWQIKPEERHLTVRPSYRIFLKGSLQRISSILPPEEVK
ncbi:MAG: C25 family cysteine peptidase, partial [Candidatus Sumerlaeia bacterium]|nr:C25 family cysteine peptidase [Candidatus Sumerlaeia bacterium]